MTARAAATMPGTHDAAPTPCRPGRLPGAAPGPGGCGPGCSVRAWEMGGLGRVARGGWHAGGLGGAAAAGRGRAGRAVTARLARPASAAGTGCGSAVRCRTLAAGPGGTMGAMGGYGICWLVAGHVPGRTDRVLAGVGGVRACRMASGPGHRRAGAAGMGGSAGRRGRAGPDPVPAAARRHRLGAGGSLGAGCGAGHPSQAGASLVGGCCTCLCRLGGGTPATRRHERGGPGLPCGIGRALAGAVACSTHGPAYAWPGDGRRRGCHRNSRCRLGRVAAAGSMTL